MGLKSAIRSGIRAAAQFPPCKAILFQPGISRKLRTLPGASIVYGNGWDSRHPFDVEYGTDTSGFVPTENLPSSPFTKNHVSIYGGSQPSIIRAALRELPPLQTFTFIDLGCGKGRPVMVAAEFPFKEAIGIELAPELAECGRQNVELFRARVPGACPMRIETGDAVDCAFPVGDLVIFLYNPFGAELMRRVADNIERTLAAGPRQLFVVYYNPVQAQCFDASTRLKHYFAATLPYADDELGFGPDAADPLVIWQAGDTYPAKPGADAKIVVTTPNVRVALK
jgi:SAM-dependent methyltransferase